MRIAICDDQYEERQRIETYLQQEQAAELDIITYESADRLLQAMESGRAYDLIYLDIEMPGRCNGMQAAELIAQRWPDTMLVFITGYKEYSTQGYKVSAMDFLVKPIDQSEFRQTYRRCRQKYEAQHKLVLEARNEVLHITAGEILLITSANKNYVAITYQGASEPFNYRATLNEMEHQLTGYGFYRCHPSYLINLEHVQKVYKDAQNNCWVTVTNGQNAHKAEVSQSKWSELRRVLHAYRRGNL